MDKKIQYSLKKIQSYKEEFSPNSMQFHKNNNLHIQLHQLFF